MTYLLPIFPTRMPTYETQTQPLFPQSSKSKVNGRQKESVEGRKVTSQSQKEHSSPVFQPPFKRTEQKLDQLLKKQELHPIKWSSYSVDDSKLSKQPMDDQHYDSDFSSEFFELAVPDNEIIQPSARTSCKHIFFQKTYYPSQNY